MIVPHAKLTPLDMAFGLSRITGMCVRWDERAHDTYVLIKAAQVPDLDRTVDFLMMLDPFQPQLRDMLSGQRRGRLAR